MNAERKHVVITGLGVYTPTGTDVEALRDHLKNGVGGIDSIQSFDTEGLDVTHAGEIDEPFPDDAFTSLERQTIDRTAQLGVLAAQECLDDADLDADQRRRLGLISGICAGGRADDDVMLGDTLPWSSREAALSFCRSYQAPQTSAVANWFELEGPTATVSTACASSNTALAYAYDLIQNGSADALLAGGADAFSPTTYAGFYALRAMAEEPCAPFSQPIGVTFGEAAGYCLLESREHAEARGATIYGELHGHGGSGDAYHMTSPHPSGEGLQRAMEKALENAGLDASDVDYVNAHGTGTRGNDSAETLAIRGLYENGASGDGASDDGASDDATPPVSSTKSFYGHTLGAAGVLEFISALVAERDGFVPPTLNFSDARPGCDLDYVPNEARDADIDTFLNTSAAFGGVNAAVVGGTYTPDRDLPPRDVDDVVVTGCGVVSSIGHGTDAFVDGLREGTCGIQPVEDLDLPDDREWTAGMVRDLNARRLVPSLRTRRMDAISTYAATASGLALEEAGLKHGSASTPEELGVVMGLARGPIGVQGNFMDAIRERGIESLGAKHFPAMVVSTITGSVAKAFSLKGFNSMIVDGTTSGLHALIHGAEHLRQHPGLDALVIVAADEVGDLGMRLYDRLGALSSNGFHPYGRLDASLDPADGNVEQARADVIGAGIPESSVSPGSGLSLGEGAAAIVLERRSSAEERDREPLAQIRGTGLRTDAHPLDERRGDGLRAATSTAFASSGLSAADVDCVFGHGRGASAYDGREIDALRDVFADRDAVPATNVLGHTGVAEAASGLFSAIAATASLQNDEVYPLLNADATADTGPIDFANETRSASVDNVLLAGGTEGGLSASVVVSSP